MKVVRPGEYVKPSRFIHFDEGDNVIRLLSPMYSYQKYGLRAGGRYLSQILRAGEPVKDIFLKAKDAEPKQQWGWIAYHHEHNRMGILECGPMLGDQLGNLMNEAGDEIRKRDIIVTRTGKILQTKYTAKFAPNSVDLGTIDAAEYKYHEGYFNG